MLFLDFPWQSHILFLYRIAFTVEAFMVELKTFVIGVHNLLFLLVAIFAIWLICYCLISLFKFYRLLVV